ncbi:MAG: hypothetical protein QME69_00990 [Candidatus Saccharicenans sp.]|nr:hypothetical protein [Candidatus Saccharicenans sp.]
MTQLNTELQVEQLEKKSRLIIRDDHYELPGLRDLLEAAAARKIKISLLDTGRFAPEELELLADFPFSFYTSDLARPDFQVLSQIDVRLKPRGCRLFYFLHGELKPEAELFHEVELFDSIFVSSREKDWPAESLSRLAGEVSRSRSSLVYYHHKNPEENLSEVGLKNCWLHISNKYFEEDSEIMLLDVVKAIKRNGGRLALHVDRGQSYSFVKELAEAGAFLIFNLPPLEPSSKMFSLVEGWRKKKLPEKAYYLHQELMA